MFIDGGSRDGRSAPAGPEEEIKATFCIPRPARERDRGDPALIFPDERRVDFGACGLSLQIGRSPQM